MARGRALQLLRVRHRGHAACDAAQSDGGEGGSLGLRLGAEGGAGSERTWFLVRPGAPFVSSLLLVIKKTEEEEEEGEDDGDDEDGRRRNIMAQW